MTRFFVCFFFLLAAAANFLSGLKYPDMEPTVWGLITTGVYFVLLVCLQGKRVFLVAGAGSLLTAFLLSNESFMVDFMFLDMLSSVQYPLFILFILPLFGLQLIFSLPLAAFAFLCAGIYWVGYVLIQLRIRNTSQA